MEEKPKKSALKTVVTIVISLAIAAVFMWWALKGIEFSRIAGYFAKANYFWVLLAAAFGIAAYWFRAVRWNLLLQPMGYTVKTSNAFWTLSFGYLMNLTIPRSGEVARATALYSVEDVPVDKSFGTIILERVIDLLCMVVFLILTLIFKYDAFIAFYKYITQQKTDTQSTGNRWLLIAGALTVVIIIFFVLRQKLQQLPLYQKIVGFLRGIGDGLMSVFRMKEKKKFIFYTAGIWVSYYLAAYLVCFALPETSGFTWADGFFIIVVGTMGMMVPASGGIGAYHLALKFGIMALFLSLGLDPEAGGEVGLSYGFISHTMQLVIMLVMGVIAIPVLARERSRKRS